MTGTPQPWRHSRHDLVLALIPIAVLVCLFAYLRPVPAEDAFILFRYAGNLAAGHGIVWNVGEDPVEGATEFSWMLLIALVMKAGLPVAGAAQALGLSFSCLGALTLYVAPRRLFGVGRIAALLVAVCYAASTTVLHAGTAFSTPLFSLLALSCFMLTCSLVERPSRAPRTGPWLALALLGLCLTRPEGVLLGGLLYAALIACRPGLPWPRFLRDQALLLVLPGAAYYAWRFAYFGYAFPNTFYVKLSDGLVNPASVARIATFGFSFCLLPLTLIGVWLVSLEASRRSRYLILVSVPLIYMAAYTPFAMIQDAGFRFVFPSYALLLVLLAPAFDALVAEPVRRSAGRIGRADVPGLMVAAALAALAAANSTRMIHASGHRGSYDDRYEIGHRLARFDTASHVMMPTEAGYLPFLSGWIAVDPFGLNDERVAHLGLTEEYIASRSPDLIMFHVDTPEYRERWSPPGADRWETMTKLMHQHAEQHGYRLVAVIQKSASPSDGYHWYYLKPGLPDGEAIAREILSVPGGRYVARGAAPTPR